MDYGNILCNCRFLAISTLKNGGDRSCNFLQGDDLLPERKYKKYRFVLLLRCLQPPWGSNKGQWCPLRILIALSIPSLPRVAQMELRIAIFVTLTVMACGRIASAGDIDQALVIKVADQAVVTSAPRIRHHRLVVRPYEPLPPVACEAVLFPRSPLCAGRPAAYGPYATFPYNAYWSD